MADGLKADSLRIEYDPASDTLIVEGVRYSGDMFRRFAALAGEGGLVVSCEASFSSVTAKGEREEPPGLVRTEETP